MSGQPLNERRLRGGNLLEAGTESCGIRLAGWLGGEAELRTVMRRTVVFSLPRWQKVEIARTQFGSHVMMYLLYYDSSMNETSTSNVECYA